MTDKTPLQIAAQLAYEEVYDKPTLPLNAGGKDFPTRIDALTDRQLVAIMHYKNGGLNDAYNTAAKATRDSGDPAPDPQAFFDTWLAELGTKKARGGGARQSPETKGWIAYFNAKGSPVTLKGKQCNGTNLNEYQDVLTRKTIWPAVKEHLLTLDEPAQRKFHAEKLPEVIQQNKPAVLAANEQDFTGGIGVGYFIEQEQLKISGEKPSTLIQVKAIIN